MTDATADLRTVSWGDRDAPNTALLVHGLTGRADNFRALTEELLEAEGLAGWRILAVDLRGRGATGRVGGPVGIPAHSADLVALMDRKGLDRVAFVGHSLGAKIGVYLAADHPDRLSRLVLVDGGSYVTDEVDALLSPVVERLERTYPSRKAYVDYLKGLPDFEDRWDENLERYFAGDVRPADLETVRDDREKMHSFPISVPWPRLGCPTLVLLSTVSLGGPDEGFSLPPQDARWMQETIPDCALVEVENTNHYDILYTAPKTTVDAISDFLARA